MQWDTCILKYIKERKEGGYDICRLVRKKVTYARVGGRENGYDQNTLYTCMKMSK